MQNQSLESAFHAALSRITPGRVAEAAPSAEHPLLAALQGSVTSFDQIVRRRIGLESEAPGQS